MEHTAKKIRSKILKTGGKVLAGKDKNMNAMMDVSLLRVVNLLTVFKHAIGSPVKSNPHILLIAEKMSHAPGIKSGKDYHFHTKRLLQGSRVKVTFTKDIYTQKIGGRNFDVLTFNFIAAGQTIKTRQYATILKGYALIFSISLTDDKGLSELMSVLNTVKM